MMGIAVHVLDFFGGELAYDLAHAYHQRVVGDMAAFWNQGARADQAVAAYDGVVQDYGLHADQRPFVDGAAVQHGLMSDRNVIVYGQRAAGIDVQHAVFLDVAAAAYLDRSIIAADADVGPDTDPGLQRDIADNIGAFENKGIAIDAGRQGFKLIYSH